MANPLVSYLIRHALAGAVAGWLTLGGLLWLDVGTLLTLIRTTDGGPVALLMLAAGFTVTFASVAMGAAVMALGREGRGPRRCSPVRSWSVLPARNRAVR